jgi:uncharacterized Zn finger protein (UPF0148 family)
MRLCPYCGSTLYKPVSDGVASCSNCSKVFDSSSFHKILSLYWLFKSYKIRSIEDLPKDYLTEEEIYLANNLIIDNICSHEELYHQLKSQGISRYIA